METERAEKLVNQEKNKVEKAKKTIAKLKPSVED